MNVDRVKKMEKSELINLIDEFKSGLLLKATDGKIDESFYKTARTTLIESTDKKELIPKFIKSCRNSTEFRRYMQSESADYAGRRKMITEDMNALIEYFELAEDLYGPFDQIKENRKIEEIGHGSFGAVYKYHTENTMGEFDFTYELPNNFHKRVVQFLQQSGKINVAEAFQRCEYEHEDVGLAYYAGLVGDNWNKKAVDFTLEGLQDDVTILKKEDRILKDAIGKSLRPSSSGYLVRNITYFISDNYGSANLIHGLVIQGYNSKAKVKPTKGFEDMNGYGLFAYKGASILADRCVIRNSRHGIKASEQSNISAINSIFVTIQYLHS